MIFLGEKETDIDIGKKLFALLRGNVDLYAEGFENVSGSGFGGGCPVAMLGNGNAAGSNDESRSGGDIEGVGAVAAGTYDLQNVHVVEKFFSVGSHGSCGSGDLVDGLALHGKSREISGLLHVAGGIFHDLIHNLFCFFISQILSFGKFDDCLFDHFDPSFLFVLYDSQCFFD